MRTAVIGGGPAGCAAAYSLGKKGHHVVLLEAQAQVGGRTQQKHREGFNLGSGALFLMGGIYPRTNALLKELGKHRELVPWDARTHVIDADGQKYEVGFDQVLSFLKLPVFSVKDKLRIAAGVASQLVRRGPKSCFDGADLARYDRGETLETWSRRVLGNKGHDYITVPYMGFLYAVPMSWLSTSLFQAILQQFYKLKLSVPPGGIGQISDWLVAGTPNLDVRTSAPVEALRRTASGWAVTAGGEVHEVDNVVVASEPGVSADLLEGIVRDEAIVKLRGCRYSEYAHAQVCWRQNPYPGERISVALPANQPDAAWGAAVLQSHRHPGTVPPGGEAVGVYFYTPPLETMTDEQIERAAIDAALQAYGPAPEPDFVELFHYRRGLSIAGPGHYATLNSVHADMPQGIALAGDYFAHAGVEAAILSGEQAVGRLSEGAPAPQVAALERAPEAIEHLATTPTSEPAAVRRTGAQDAPASGTD
jgi:oxygen-dependent protoporphyrinogen oxidase